MNPFLGQITTFAGNFAPRGWAFCDGQLLPIAQNSALFSILGTTYGGDGRTTFALPDLRGRIPIHTGQSPGGSIDFRLGFRAGEEEHTLTQLEMPSHSHALPANAGAGSLVGPTSNSPSNAYPAEAALAGRAVTKYNSTSDTTMGATDSQGTRQAHNNMQPSLALNYIIAIVGIFPSRN